MKKDHLSNKNDNNKFVNCKRVTVIDKLELTACVENDILKCSYITSDIRLEIDTTNTFHTDNKTERLFRFKFNVYQKKQLIANILYKDNCNQEHNCIIKFSNSLFYSKFNTVFVKFINNNILKFENIKIFKLDIALDFNYNFIPNCFKYYGQWRDKVCYLYGGALFTEDPSISTYYIGRSRYLTIYNKTQELKESKNNNKAEYISEFHSKNDFEMNTDNTRVELRIKRSNVRFINKLLKDIEIEKLIDNNYITYIITKEIEKRLVVIFFDNLQKNRGRLKKEPLINVDMKLNYTYVGLDKIVEVKNGSLYLAKIYTRILTYMWILHAKNDIESDLYLTRQKLINRYKLDKWVEQKILNDNDFENKLNKFNNSFFKI